jgi:hypothetical protein
MIAGTAAAPVTLHVPMKPLTLTKFLARISVAGAPPIRIVFLPIAFAVMAEPGPAPGPPVINASSPAEFRRPWKIGPERVSKKEMRHNIV